MDYAQVSHLFAGPVPQSQMQGEILDFVSPDCPHKKIGRAYDKAAGIYDDYIGGESFLMKTARRINLGLDKEVVEECGKITKNMLEQVKNGIILDIPAGTGIITFEEYIKYPKILFIAAEYSWGMIKKAKKRIEQLNAKNILLIRADAGNLPFKNDSFLLCYNLAPNP